MWVAGNYHHLTDKPEADDALILPPLKERGKVITGNRTRDSPSQKEAVKLATWGESRELTQE